MTPRKSRLRPTFESGPKASAMRCNWAVVSRQPEVSRSLKLALPRKDRMTQVRLVNTQRNAGVAGSQNQNRAIPAVAVIMILYHNPRMAFHLNSAAPAAADAASCPSGSRSACRQGSKCNVRPIQHHNAAGSSFQIVPLRWPAAEPPAAMAFPFICP